MRAGAHGCQKVLYSLKLKLQVVVSHLSWVPGILLGSSEPSLWAKFSTTLVKCIFENFAVSYTVIPGIANFLLILFIFSI